MLYYERNNIGKETDPTKSNKSKECMIWHYWFLNYAFKRQNSVCNGCHDLTMLSFNVSDITIITVKNTDYRCIIHNSKSGAINLLESAVLQKRGCILKILSLFSVHSRQLLFILFLFIIYKMTDIMNMYKSLNISIGTVMKSSEILKFVPDHLKTKKVGKHAVKKLPFL